jgi:hypothetical protein
MCEDTTYGIRQGFYHSSTGGWCGTHSNHNMRFGANWSTKMTITTNGYVAIGSGLPSFPLHVTRVPSNNNPSTTAHNFLRFGNSFSASAGGLGANQFPVQIYAEGGSIMSNAGLYSISDRRIKEKIHPLNNIMDKLMQLNPITYEYIDKTTNGFGVKWGFIAQEVQDTFPDFVRSEQEQYIPSVFKLCVRQGNTFMFSEPHGIEETSMLNFHKENGSICDIICVPTSPTVLDIQECCQADCEIEEGEEVICYGIKVQDFRSFDQIGLVSVCVKAIQEIYYENQKLNTELTTSIDKIDVLETQLVELNTKYDALLTRIINLEAQ